MRLSYAKGQRHTLSTIITVAKQTVCGFYGRGQRPQAACSFHQAQISVRQSWRIGFKIFPSHAANFRQLTEKRTLASRALIYSNSIVHSKKRRRRRRTLWRDHEWPLMWPYHLRWSWPEMNPTCDLMLWPHNNLACHHDLWKYWSTTSNNIQI